MKRSISAAMIAGILTLLTGSASASAISCNRHFMKDRCAHDGYSIVETERFVRGPHNCMAIAHYFPGEEPACYCGHCGKNAARATAPVARVD
ncbi:hypothetical protein [Nitratifractor sp.]